VFVTWKLERAVRLELTNTGFAVRSLGRLATRAQILYLVFCALFFELFKSEAREHKHKSTKYKVQNTALYDLERKERFELSKRVWKTRMFPATSLPRVIAALRQLEI